MLGDQLEGRSDAAVREPDRVGDRTCNLLDVADRLERDEPDAVGVSVGGRGGKLERKARLADPSGSGQREESGRLEESQRGRQLVVAAHEGRQLGGQVVRAQVQGADRREVGLKVRGDQLGEALRAEVLEAMLAEVADRHVGREPAADECAGRFRDEDLPAVACRCDPGGAVNLERGVVAVGGRARLTGVEPHPDADRSVGRPRVGGQAALRGDAGCGRGTGVREDDEERVTLRLDLDAPGLREGRPEDRAMRFQERPVGCAEACDQRGRALDVREQEGHRSCGQRSGCAGRNAAPGGRGLGRRYHGRMLPQDAGCVNLESPAWGPQRVVLSAVDG